MFICNKHDKALLSYCNKCNNNLCLSCEEQHDKKHILLSYKEFKKTNKNKLINSIKEIIEYGENINQYKNEIQKLSNYFSLVLENTINELNLYTLLNEKIMTTYENLYNYQRLTNLFKIKNKILEQNMNKFFKMNIKNKMKTLFDILNNRIKNEITIEYNIKDTEIKLFGKIFVKNNKDKCVLFINEQIFDLCEFYYINKEYKEKTIIIKLIETKKITNMSYMFYNCI